MRPGKSQNSVGTGQGRNQIQNRASSHLPNENHLRSQQAFPVQNLQTLMMQPRAAYMTGPPMPIPQRTMRPNHRGPMYSSSPQGTTMPQHYGLTQQQQQQQQQNMTYAGMMHQDQYQMLHHRQYVVPAAHYQLPPNTSYTQYVQQAAPQYYNPNVPVNPMYYVQQQTAQPQQAQQQNTGNNPSIQNNNMNKPSSKTKRGSKITIRDPKDNKDVTDEILKSHAANHTTGANGKQSGTPPLSTSSAAQTESSSIQATFAAQVAAAVGDGKRPNNKKQEPADKIEKVEQRHILKPEPLEQNQVGEETLHVADISKKETEQKYSVLSKTVSLPQVSCENNDQNNDARNTVTKATSLHETKTDLMNKVEILSNENRTEILKRNNQELVSSGLAKTESKVEKILSSKDVDQVNTAKTEQEQVIPSVADKEPEIRNGVTEINNEPIDKDLDVREVNPHSTNSVTEESRSEALIKDVNNASSKTELENNGETAITDDLKLSKSNVSTGADNNIGSNNVDVTLDHNSPNDKQKEVTPEESKDAVESEHVFVDVDKDTQQLSSSIPSAQQQAQQQQEPRQEEQQQEEPQEQHQEQQPEQQQQQPKQQQQQEEPQEQQPEQQQQQQPKQQQQQQEPQEQQPEQQQQQPKQQQQQQEEPQEQQPEQQLEQQQQQPKQQQQQEEPQEQQQPEQQQQQQQQPKELQEQQQQTEQQQEQQQQPKEQQQQEQQQQQQQQQTEQQQEQQQQPKEQQQEQQQQTEQQQQQQQDHQQQQQQDQQQQQQQDQQQQQQQEQRQQQQQQQQKTGEQPKKKSSKQRIREMNKKESDGSLMDAYMDKPPPAPEPVVQEKVKDPEVVAKKVEKPSDEDLSWEDKGEKIGDEITIEKESETEATEQTKLKYERDFLLQFQFMQVCTEKPAGLPDIEVVLDAPVPPSKMNVQRGGVQDFLPSYARQKSQGGGGRRDSRGKAQPRKIITPIHQPPVELKKSENRWTRAQTKEHELTEEEKQTAELYRVVVAILNKLTPQKFKTLVERIMQLNIDTPERLEGVIDRIFEKAIGEPVFSVAYASMCRCLFPIKVSSPDEKDVTFRKLLLNRCQKEFEKEKEDEKAFLEKQTQLEVLLGDERKVKKEEMDEEAGRNKRRMLGNIKFIGELFKLKLLTENIMHDCIFKLLRAGDEESLESMCKLLFTIGKDLDSEKAKPRIEQYFEQINKNISGKKVSSRVCFMLRDVVDLRKNNWIPRREENYNPKTIDQIHKEAQLERSQEQRNANMSKEAAKQKQKGGGRDSPKPNATSGDGGWMVSGRSGKPVAIDPNKLKSMAGKKSNPDEKISLGPSGRSLGGFGQWGRGSTGGVTGTTSSQQEQESQGNRFSALSAGDTMPPNRPYDPRKSSAPGRPSSAGRTSDKRPTKSDREKAIDAARAISKPQITAKTEIPQTTSNNVQDKTEVEIIKPTKEDIPQEKEPLSEEEMIKKTGAIVDEFVNIEDLEEACRCFTDLQAPELHSIFVTTAIEHTYEMDAKARKVTGRLLNTLLTNVLKKDQFRMGLNKALGNAEDNAIDYPKLWCYLAEIITPVIIGGHFSLSDLKPLIIMHVVQYNKAGVFLAEILTLVEREYDKNKAILVWTDSNIRWSEVLPNDITADEFLEQKNLTFLPSDVDELKKLLSEGTVTNDVVFVCIEKNFKEEKRKERPFISHLASVVAESCLIEKDSEHGLDCCVEKLKARKNILHKYLDNNHDLELEVLFALQALYVRHNKPSKMLSSFFNTLYDEEVITEDSFLAWKSDENPERQEAKGPALQATASFFEWLQSAAVEGNE